MGEAEEMANECWRGAALDRALDISRFSFQGEKGQIER
jgi:hypothetical protein